jgi:hypothetical protein
VKRGIYKDEGDVSYAAKLENWLKMIFRLSPNIQYYGRMFGV